MRPSLLTTVALALVLSAVVAKVASAQVMPKAQVANLIVKVENGVDEFRNYLEKRGENAKDAENAAQASGRRSRKGASGRMMGERRKSAPSPSALPLSGTIPFGT